MSEHEQAHRINRPMPEGVLFHTQPHDPSVDVEQILFTLAEPVDTAAFAQAWQTLVARHPILRSGFSASHRRVQSVSKKCHADIETLDWRAPDDDTDRQRRLNEFLRRDRLRGFDLAAPPLFRVTLIRWTDDTSRVVWTLRRALLDGRSLTILLREWWNCHATIVTGSDSDIVPTTLLATTPAWPEVPAGDTDAVFWRDYLNGFNEPNVVDLPEAAQRVPRPGTIHCVERTLDEAQSDAVRRLAKTAGVTLNNLMQSAWALLLSHYTGASDIVFGITRCCRRSGRPGTEDAVGPFLNVIPMRVRIRDKNTVLELLRQLRDQHRRVREYECSSLIEIAHCADLGDDESLFDSLFEFDARDPMTALAAMFPASGPRDFRHFAGARHALHIQAYGEKRLVLRLKYDDAKYDGLVAARLLDHYASLLAGMARDPLLPAKDVPYLSAEDRAPCVWPDSLAEQGMPAATEVKPVTLHERFAASARATPAAIAVACGERQIGYAELERAANGLARRLRDAGARPGMLIGLCVERSIEQVIAILGILKSGAAYLPLDPAYPRERLNFMLGDADAHIVVAPVDTHARLPERDLVLIDPQADGDNDGNNDDGEPTGNDTTSDVSADDLAYVIYTSGSTGQPKGVQITHRNVTRLFDACQGWLRAGPQDVWTLFHSVSFDFSVWEIWGALLHGGRLEIVPADIARIPDAFYALLAERGVTVLNQTPSAFMQLQKVDAAQRHPLPALRLIVFGGERLDVRELRGWLKRRGDAQPRLVNMYGITETTVHVTYRPIRHQDAESSDSPIGWPLPDLRVHLLRDGRPVPPGVRGEICVGGGGVARGYLNRPELTAERFVVPGSSVEGEERLYRSGDFARRMPDGELHYLGRDDAQVKIRGHRIDPGEVAYALRRLSGVSDATVVARANADRERHLIGYYVLTPAQNDEPDEATLRERLAALVPAYMLPAALIRVARIPVTANGKIDVKALPDNAATAVANDSALAPHEPPVTPMEQTLAAIWAELLERREIGRDADFFRLGGDSILVLQTAAKARARGIEITPREVFAHTTLAELARVARQIPTRQENQETVLKPAGRCALTPIQHWFFEQSFEKPDWWNQAFLFRVPPDCDVDLLERACRAAVTQHDALSLRFTRDNRGRWQAEYGNSADACEFSHVELDHLDENERREAIGLIARDIQNSLSLTSGLLMRVAHFSGGLEGGDRVLIAIHHLAVDAASWGILLQDIDTAYRALLAGKTPVLPRRTTTYGQWAKQLEKHAASSSVAAERAFWDETMSDEFAGHTWPESGADASGFEKDVRTHHVTLEPSETVALHGIANRAYGTEPHELFVAGLARACAEQWPDCDSLRIDVEHHGRDHDFEHIDLSRTVGWFTTLHPLALDLRKTRNPARGICDVKARLRSVPHRGIGWGLLRYLRPPVPARQTRSRILFSHLGHFERLLGGELFQLASEDAGPWRSPENRLAHDLRIVGQVRDERLEFEFRYNANVLDDAAIESLAHKYRNALRLLIGHCKSRERVTRTPEDFPLARMTQQELDAFPIDLQQVEDILPLTPIQRLYHALSGTDKDVGFDQWVFRLQGDIDETAFEEAWRELLRRHDVLRSVFVDRGLDEARQVVFRNVEFNLQRTDWRLLTDAEQTERLAEFIEADRREGFTMGVAPLTRVTLIRAGDDRWILVWSHHQAQVDGWSWPVLSRELGEIHDALRASQRPRLETPGSYRSYITWLMERDLAAYSRFWHAHLGNCRAARSLISKSRRKGDGHRGPREIARSAIKLDAELSAGIAQLARDLRLTPSVVFQAAWSLLLSALTTRFDVTLGVTFSGRTAGIPVAADTVGPFVNNLPVRVRISPTVRVDRWLANLRGMHADLNHYQNASPTEILSWSGSMRAGRLFDSLLVFQNYMTGDAMHRWGEHIRVTEFKAGARTNYPLTVTVTPGKRYRVEFIHDSNLLDAATVQTLSRHLVTVLTALSRSPEIRIDTILKRIAGSSSAGPSATPDAQQRHGQWRRRASDRATTPRLLHGAAEPQERSSLTGRIAAVCREVLDIPVIGLEQNFFDVGAQSVSLLEIHARLQDELRRTFPIVRLFQHPTVAELARYLRSGDSDDDLWIAAYRGAAQRAAMQRRERDVRSEK